MLSMTYLSDIELIRSIELSKNEKSDQRWKKHIKTTFDDNCNDPLEFVVDPQICFLALVQYSQINQSHCVKRYIDLYNSHSTLQS